MSAHADRLLRYRASRRSPRDVVGAREDDLDAALWEGAAALREVAELRARMEDARKLAETYVCGCPKRHPCDDELCQLAQRILAHPAPAPAPWVLDERIGIVAVYRGPKRECLDGIVTGEDVPFVAMGTRVDGAWQMDPEDVKRARQVYAALSKAPAPATACPECGAAFSVQYERECGPDCPACRVGK